MGKITITKESIDRRFHLDNEIRELIAFSFDMYGENGLRYVSIEIEKIINTILKEDLS